LANRDILDSVLVANETIDEAKRINKSCIVFKPGFKKAYDSVNWEYLVYMMGSLGFNTKWVK